MEGIEDLDSVLLDFRGHFDQYYLGAIPKLLNEEGKVLAFISIVTALECLAGLYMPSKDPGPRYQSFIRAYFSEPYHPLAKNLWTFRNLMVHAFNPMPFRIGCHQSQFHLLPLGEEIYLNAEDMYGELLGATRRYFLDLYKKPELKEAFAKRIMEKGGGRPQTTNFIGTGNPHGPAV